MLDDRTGMLTDELTQVISVKLADDSISYTTTVDYSNRCGYYYTRLDLSGTDLVVSVIDCYDILLGSKNLGDGNFWSPWC